MRVLRPHYRGANGQLVDNPLTAAGPRPVVDVGGLARLFTTPGLLGEFMPSSYFTNVEVVWPPIEPAVSDLPLKVVFDEAVDELCAGAGTVAVSLSGGLDSLAVLVSVLSLRPRRRVVAFVVDLVDDDGRRAPAVVHQVLAEIGMVDRVDVQVIAPAHPITRPAWPPHGPRLDALPQVNATMACLAAERGADVLLSGDGADELLAVPRFATVQVLRCRGLRATRQYLADMACSGPGALGEVLAGAASLLPASTRARLYWATNWPEWSVPTVSPVLATRYQEAALTWANEWVTSTIAAHGAARRSWAAADAFDAWWPRNYRPPAGVLAEASPFLHPDVVAAAWGLPLAERYDATASSAYHRAKALVVGLFPPTMRARLPRVKQLYRNALATAVSGPIEVPIAAELGLLDAQALAVERDTATRMTAAAVEDWLAGVVTAGISVNL